MRKFAILAMLALLPPFLSAARLMLRDGTVIYGHFVSGSPQVIVFQDDNGLRRRFPLNRVQSIDFLEPVTELDRGIQSADRMAESRDQRQLHSGSGLDLGERAPLSGQQNGCAGRR